MDPNSYREKLYETFTRTGEDLDDRVAQALEIGTEYLDVSIGFLTRIEDRTQEIVQSVGEHPLIRPGETCPLEDAYCRRTVSLDGSLAVQDAAASTAISESAVRTFDLGTYIGVKVVVDDEVYGTVCFADEAERGVLFTESEELFVELLARLIGRAYERRAHERELRERNERLRAEKRRFEGIADASFDVLFRIDLDCEFTYVSSAVERMLGHDPEALVGAPFDEFVAEESVPDAVAAYSRVLDGEPVENLELDFVAPDGTTVALEVNVTPIRTDGRVTGAQGVGRDVTARRERERELRIKDRAMNEARIGISIADDGQPDQPLAYVNEGFERITGYDAEAVVGRNCRFLQGPATDPEPVDRIRAGIERDEPTAVELVNYRADGTPFWNRLRISPVEYDDGTVTHYLGFQVDVTDRKRTEQLVRLLNRVLRHNLRNDMTAVLGYSALLEDGDDVDGAAIAARIRRVVDGLIELSDTVRELERYATRERDPQRLDTAAVLGGVADRYRERFPDAAVDLHVRTDRGICVGPEIERAVAELVENGLTHNPSAERRVEIEAVDDGDAVEITVADDGPGIDDVEAAVVSRGRESKLEHGTGLGLWLVNWIVTRYGGSFRVRAAGDGTVATLHLPAIDPDTSVDEAARRPTVLFQ